MSTPCLSVPEDGTWDFNPYAWKQLFGSFYGKGVSIEWHDFTSDREIPWSKSFHENSLELCLNFSGFGSMRRGQQQASFTDRTVGYYFPVSETLNASRASDEHHQFLTLEMSRSFLQSNLSNDEETLAPSVRSFLSEKKENLPIEVRPMDSNHIAIGTLLREPPPLNAGRSLWYQSKTLELLSYILFDQAQQELFCSRQKRIAKERVEHLKSLLCRNLEAPPSLKSLGKEVGCSPFHLSRIFSKETGMTIPLYLRKIRMERAGELLRSGKYNVTEAALEVGYSSMSHFSKAFYETYHCCPCFYPMIKERHK
jgi:AraC family transcriptional regulator